MTQTTKNAVEAENQPVVKKVNRRGVNNSTRGTTRLKFNEKDAFPNVGLFLAHLDSVEVTNITIGEDKTGMPSFNGLEIPKIVFTFASNDAEATKRKYVSLSFNAVESNVETIPGGTSAWKVDTVFDWFKHILNVYILKGKEMTTEQEELLSLPFEDFDENGEYIAVEPEEVIAGWRTLFENFASILNKGNEDSPVYFTKDKKVIPVWIKLIRYIKNKKKGWVAVNNGELSFPTFVGEGCIEMFKQNVKPSICLNKVSERITPMELEKDKTPNVTAANNPYAALGGGVMMGNMPGFGSEEGLDNMGINEDVPF